LLIDCKSISNEIDANTKDTLSKTSVKAKLVSFAVAPDSGTISYLKSQKKKASSLGIEYEMIIATDVDELKALLKRCSKDSSVHGIFVSHPLPDKESELEIVQLVNPNKDIEGRNPNNLGMLIYGHEQFSPCTAQAVIEILERSTSIMGKKATIIGRSPTVGMPVSLMLLKRERSATVTVCHTKTRNLQAITKDSDIVVVAVGRAGFLKPEMVKEGAIVIDVGINIVESKIVGDVDNEVQEKAWITPVPGGVGSVTTSVLMNRVALNAARSDKI